MNKLMNNKKFFKNKSGFTLLETLVAIMLFVIALSALLALVRDSVTSATYTKNDVVATYLAQEGIDYIRNVRDEMVHVNPTAQPWTDFTTFIMSTSSCSTGCELNVYNATKLGPYANTPIFAKFTRKITMWMRGLG